MSHPKIKGIRWLDEEIPDLIAVSVTLVNRTIQELDIPGMVIPETPSELFIDLNKLAGVGPWYPKGSDDPSETECSIDVEGMISFVGNVNIKDMLEVWIYFKKCKQ